MKSGHIKDQLSDDNGYRKFVINCLGENDQRNYFSISPFGIDFNVPIGTRCVTEKSKNKDVVFSLGVLNKLKIEDLNPGENAIYSTDESGENIVSQIVFRNTGDIEINKDFDNGSVIIGVDGSIEISGTGIGLLIDGDADIVTSGNINLSADGDVAISAGGNVTIDATQVNMNSGNLTVD